MLITRRALLSAAAVAPLAAAGGKTPVIDIHCHAGKGQALTAPWTTEADIDLTLSRMKEAGIDKTVVFPINNHSYERPNQEIAALVAKHPDKLIGFAKHDAETESGIPQILRREVEREGLRGLKLHRHPTREMLDVTAELKIPVLYHPSKPSDFHLIASEYPQVTFVMAHLGNFASRVWQDHIAAIDIAKRYPNVYLDTSSVVFQEFLEMAAAEVPEKLVFGTDGPELDSRVEIHKVRLLKLSPEKEQAVLGGTAARILGL